MSSPDDPWSYDAQAAGVQIKLLLKGYDGEESSKFITALRENNTNPENASETIQNKVTYILNFIGHSIYANEQRFIADLIEAIQNRTQNFETKLENS